MVVSALIMLTASRSPRVPAWLVVGNRRARARGNGACAPWPLQNGIVLEADELGKYKTIYQMFALHGLLLHYPFLGIDFQGAGHLLPVGVGGPRLLVGRAVPRAGHSDGAARTA